MRVYSSSLVKLSLPLHKQNSNDLWKFLLSNFYHNLVHYMQNNFLAWCIYLLFAKNPLNLSSYFSRNNNCKNFFFKRPETQVPRMICSAEDNVKGISSTKETQISPRVYLYSDWIGLDV